jgi:hypothetical protein
MIKCPHCKKDSRFMWVSMDKNPQITTANVIEILFLKRILFYCAISLPPTMIWAVYFLLVNRG